MRIEYTDPNGRKMCFLNRKQIKHVMPKDLAIRRILFALVAIRAFYKRSFIQVSGQRDKNWIACYLGGRQGNNGSHPHPSFPLTEEYIDEMRSRIKKEIAMQRKAYWSMKKKHLQNFPRDFFVSKARCIFAKMQRKLAYAKEVKGNLGFIIVTILALLATGSISTKDKTA